MLTNILIAVICMAAFLTSFWAYRRGLKDGIALNNNKPIEPIKSPVAVIQERREAKEIKEENDKIAQGLSNILNFDGTPQKEDEE
jgi:hypothetical protein